MALPDLLKAIREPRSAGDRSNDDGVALSYAELAWLRRLHRTVRNQFVHFGPLAWSIEVSGLRALAPLVARLLGEMAGIGWAFRHEGRPWREALGRDLARLSAPGWPADAPDRA